MFQSLLPKKKKEDTELDQNSLLARAFSNKTDKEKLARPTTTPVATYHDPYANLRRSLMRVSLTIILPIVGLLIIGFVTINIVLSNIKEEVISAETVTMDNVPVPANVQRISANDNSSLNYFKNQVETLMPGYSVKVSQVQRYIALGATGKNILDYYQAKLVDTKQWKIQKQIGLSTALDTLYTRPLSNGQLEGIMLEIPATSYNDLLKISNTDLNGSNFVLAKLLATRR